MAIGLRQSSARDGLTATVEDDGGRLVLRMVSEGRIFGGNYSVEISPEEPVLPATTGLVGRPRGRIRLQGMTYRPRGNDAGAADLARRLERDERLNAALAAVHFDRVRVEPDGRPVIRHIGGCVVWILFPPLVRIVPLVPEQARAVVEAMDAFAAAGRSAPNY